MWADVRLFVENPEEALEDARAQLVAADENGDLEVRLASLTKRLAAEQTEKDRYIKPYRFGPPITQGADGFSHGVADSLLWYNARS